MNLQYRIDLLSRLGEYILSNDPGWLEVRDRASRQNGWFIPAFIDAATEHIGSAFLQKNILEKWVASYLIPPDQAHPKTVGVVMAGNIPLVGFHDLLSVFISGHRAHIKPSSKDDILPKHLVGKLAEWEPESAQWIVLADMLRGCDAYIATGSNNSAGYFEYYFGKYPHIIRRNRTSAAVLDGSETNEELDLLADDVYLFFGLGCRNVTKLYVPRSYDFVPLLRAFDKYNHLVDQHKYKHNYDYNLAILLLNKKPYMSNASILLSEDASLFSPIGQLHYEYYDNSHALLATLRDNADLQCIVGKQGTPFGQAQHPAIDEYADGVDTLGFLSVLP